MLIGHASIDENKKAKNGKAGDQTGKEVCTRSWYANSWDVLLRCTDPIKAELMAQACEKGCANNHIGYDQNQRNSLRTQAALVDWDLSKITTNCETDCSAFMTVCAECAGIAIPYNKNNAPTTSTMQKAFVSTELFDDKLTGKKYFESDKYLKRGDILIRTGKHTAMILGNGAKAGNVQNQAASVQNIENSSYKVGKVYTLTSDLYIREQPFGEKMKFSCITQNAQAHGKFDDYGNAILLKGTRVTCMNISQQTDSIWILIPSGWVCAKNKTNTYIK